MHLDEDLEVIARQVGDLVHGEGQLYLKRNIYEALLVRQNQSLRSLHSSFVLRPHDHT